MKTNVVTIKENLDLTTLRNKRIHDKKLKIYKKHRRYMGTGDVVAFQGNDPGAKIIRKYTKSKYSHVGLVMDVPGLDRKFIIESVPVGGVVLMPLSFKIKTYKGQVWWMPVSLAKRKRTALYKDMMYTLGRGYDFESIGNFAKKIFIRSKRKPSMEDFSRLICSELVGMAYKTVGLLKKTFRVVELTPKDVVDLGVYRKNVKLI